MKALPRTRSRRMKAPRRVPHAPAHTLDPRDGDDRRFLTLVVLKVSPGA